ncbi:MAG: hypothetical protein ABI237_03220 [Ginsengibacter sp.]
MKDIFIDADITNKFSKTTDKDLIELIEWLLNKENKSFLLVSDYLRNEYLKGNAHCVKEFSISTIYFKLQQDGRLNAKTKKEIEDFKQKHFSKTIWKNLNCLKQKKGKNRTSDPNHIALIYLSDRRFALTEDENLFKDLNELKFKREDGKKVTVAKSPTDINYKTSEAD